MTIRLMIFFILFVIPCVAFSQTHFGFTGGAAGGGGDMLQSVYDPAGGAAQVAFQSDLIADGTAIGQALWWSGTAWVNTETNEIVYDDTNKFFGIGTPVPISELEVTNTAPSTQSIITVDSAVSGQISGVQFREAGIIRGSIFQDGSTNDFYIGHGPLNKTQTFINGGNVGFSDLDPVRNLTVSDQTGDPQFRLGYDAGQTYFADIRATSDGFLEFLPSHGQFGFNTPNPNSLINIDVDDAPVSRIINIEGAFTPDVSSNVLRLVAVITPDADNLVFTSVNNNSRFSGNRPIAEYISNLAKLEFSGTSSAVIDDAYGYFIAPILDSTISGTPAVNTFYGMYLSNQTFATDNYGIYQVGAAQVNYFGGDVGIGVVDPVDKFEVRDATGPQFTASHDTSNTTTFETDASGDMTVNTSGGDVKINDVVDVDAVQISTSITTTQFGASQDNWNPSGMDAVRIIRMGTTGGNYELRGLNPIADRELILLNVAGGTIKITNESVSSTAAWRFALAADISLKVHDSCIIWYDTAELTGRWKMISKNVN